MEDPVKCYCTFVWPILEYAASVWNPGFICHQINCLERIERHTLCIISPDLNYKGRVGRSGLPTLQQCYAMNKSV